MILDRNKLVKQMEDILQNGKASMDELSHGFDIASALQNHFPNEPENLFFLATFAAKRKQVQLAFILFEKCLSLPQPDYKKISALINMGAVYKQEDLIDNANHCYYEAELLLKKCPKKGLEDWIEDSKAAIYTNRACNLVASGAPGNAVNIINKALKTVNKDRCPSDYKRILWNKSLILLEQGKYGEGFDLYDNVSDSSTRPFDRSYPGEPKLWNGEKGKNVIVIGEQGIGDELMFASILPDLIKDCKNVVFDAHLRLADMFRRSFDIPVYGTRELNCLMWQPPCELDYKIPIGSLAKFYRKKEQDFPGDPYIVPDENLVKKARSKLEQIIDKDLPCIGISWRGGVKATNKSSRRIKLESWLPLMQNVKANWISLQYHPTAAQELERFEKQHGIKVHHLQPMLDDYEMTAGLVKNLDLILSVPQSVVHLAGSLGVKTWQLTPKKAMWQMGVYGKDMPWYKCVKNYWQKDEGDWEYVINNVLTDIKNGAI